MPPNSGGLLLLDEYNSAVDSDADRMMKEVVRREFAHHTVICVAHRLDGVMDFDRVAVMDGGRLVEMGPPDELLKRPGGRFKALVDAGGKPPDSIREVEDASGAQS